MSTIETLQDAANVAIVLNYGDGDQAIISSVFNWKPSGFTRNRLNVETFREDPRQLVGGKVPSDSTFSAYTIFGDAGQKILKDYANNKTAFGPVGHANGHCRFYYNLPVDTETASLLSENFRTLDTANDSIGVYRFTDWDPQAVDPNGVFQFNSGIAVGGREADFYVHYTASTIAAVDSDPDTITDSASGFVTAGFEAGMTIIVEGSTNFDGIYGPLASVAAGTMTLPSGDELTAEAASESITIHGGY